ncbi:unnamed protein product, partial [Nesidiocoris tenuis]
LQTVYWQVMNGQPNSCPFTFKKFPGAGKTRQFSPSGFAPAHYFVYHRYK